MTATVCAWCKAHSNMTPVSTTQMIPLENSSAYQLVQAGFRCNHCKKLSIGSSMAGARESFSTSGIEHNWWDGKKIHWTPEQVGGRDFPDVPAHIAPAADEAFKCRSIDALRSAILLARSVIEATCKDKGVTSGPLASKINDMTAKGFIRPFTQDAAHELRYLGNDMAHGDFVNEVDAADADAVLEVMAEILNEVYQGPARVSRMKAKRNGDRQVEALAKPAALSGADFSGAGER